MKIIREPNYTQVPNIVLDSLSDFKSEAELKVVLTVIRQTLGWHKKSDKLSISQLQKKTGMARASVVAGIERAVAAGWIEKKPRGQSFSYSLLVQKLAYLEPSTSSETELLTSSETEHTKETIKQNTLGGKNGRPHDELFDAVAEVCRADPHTVGSSIGKIVASLRKGDPPYTADEVRAFSQWWWGWKERQAAPTLWQLNERIGLVRDADKDRTTRSGQRLPDGV